MKSSLQDLPVRTENSRILSRGADWGGMYVATAEIFETLDVAPLLKGLPDDRCQCPHWGYILKGQMRSITGDEEEVFNEGDLFYLPPGHAVIYEKGTQYIEFSPSEEVRKTMEVAQRNMRAMAE